MRKKEIQNKKLNARLYPIYKMVSWDLLFYYSIIYLFLVQAKGFTASQILLSEAFFTASCLILQIPLGLLVDRFGKKNSLVFANICLCVFTLILLFVNNYTQLLIAFFIDAIGYVIKGTCETNILYDSLPRGKKRGSLYSRIDGKGTARYYVIDAITSLIAGYAFVVSPYLPIILCLIGNIIAIVVATRFRHTKIPIEEDDDIRTGAKEYFKQLKDAMKFAITSKRLLCLLIFFGLMTGLNYNLTTFRGGVLEQIQLPEQYFGLVFAMIQIAAAICSGLQRLIHRKFRNKTLSVLGIPMTSFLILIGLFAVGNPTNFKTILVITLFVILGGVKGAHNVLIYRYLNNFTNREIRTKLSTVRNIVYNLFTIAISLFGSWLLSITNASNSIMILGVIATTIMILLLYYMKDKVGLKVDDYSDEDLKYSHVIK
ncbi:MAG: MFS transporter [Clostridia bacterium]|nr:MFS transporter [Clostridia bacterium]